MYSKNHSRISAIIPACRHIGIGPSVNPPLSSLPLRSKVNRGIDSPDFYESSFWTDSDPKSGLGGWGDPKADYRVPDGGFHTLPLSYPSPHTVRRNFTLLLPPFPGAPPPPIIDNNASISASVIEAILNISPGDYKQFQTVVEAPGVRKWAHVTAGRDFSHLDVHVRVRTLPCTRSWAGELFRYCVCFGTSHLRGL